MARHRPFQFPTRRRAALALALIACGTPSVPSPPGMRQNADAGAFNSGPDDVPPSTDAGPRPAADAGSQRADANRPSNPPDGDDIDWRQAGAWRAEQQFGSLQVQGCSMNYRWLRASRSLGTVILLHGFQRNGANMIELAEHLASHGFATLVPDLCFLSMLNSDPGRAAQALAILIDQQVEGPRLYVGFSAGSMVAANSVESDPQSVGLFGLDPVAPRQEDQAPQGWQSEIPVAALVGQASRCNESNSGWPLYRAWGATGWRLRAASHCQFEGPSDAMCRMMCGGGTEDEAPSAVQRHLVTAFAQATLAEDRQAMQVWRGDGRVMNDWIAGGALTRP